MFDLTDLTNQRIRETVMKRVFIALAVLFLASALHAQLAKMRLVGKPEKSESEIIGRRDVNGRFCAAIKVLSDMEGFTYDAYNGVVGDVEHQAGMDIVYLQPDERVLQIFHSGYEPLKIILSEVGIRLKPKEMWVIRIKGAPKKADMLPVTIFVQPSDARIAIDGKAVQSGKAVELSKGRHRLVIKKDGYKTVDKPITVSKDHVVFNETLSEVDLQQVVIKSVPDGARIFLNNVEKGVTDDGFFLYPGQYQLKLSKSGYVDVSEAITVTENGNNTFTYRLVKNSGILRLNVTPAGADIKLNQKDYSGQTRIELLPGTYELEVSKTGYLPQKEIVEIERGKTLERSYQLIKNSGSLSLNVTPADAAVLINKEDYSNRGHIELAPGRYKIEIMKEGYYPQSETITIQRGQTLNKTYNLTAKTGKLQFKVKPLTARVTLKQNGQTVQTWTGMKYLKDLPVGEYELKCSADGYQPWTRRITVSENRTTAMEVVLKKGPITFKDEFGIEWVWVEGGTFEMGCTGEQSNCASDEKPAHTVTVDGFYMSKYEVTFAQYDQFCEATGRSNPNDKGWGRGNRPVINVSWHDAVAFCKWLSKRTGTTIRLPTEAEWEYAARGGQKSRHYKYSGSNDVDAVAWYDGNSSGKTHPVGQKQPNELGLYDMSGNVWEWCQDWYDNKYYANSPHRTPRGPTSGNYRVLRGGSWVYDAWIVRVASRGRYDPEYGNLDFGFRIARDY